MLRREMGSRSVVESRDGACGAADGWEGEVEEGGGLGWVTSCEAEERIEGEVWRRDSKECIECCSAGRVGRLRGGRQPR